MKQITFLHALVRMTLMSLAGFILVACNGKSQPSLQGEIAQGKIADLVFTNGKIYTVDKGTPWAESLSIREGLITAVGSNEQVEARIGTETKVIDLDGELLMPAFGDAHVHPVFGGLSYSRCSLHGNISVEQYAESIKACVDKASGDEVVYGTGWLPGLFPPDGIPDKDILDAIAPDRAVIMRSTGGHSLWVNSVALDMAGITRDTLDPEKGRIDRDPETGEPVGGLQEAAMDLVSAYVPQPTSEEMQGAIVYTAKLFNSLGITNWHDAGIEIDSEGNSPTLDAYISVKEQGKLTTHVSMALKWDNDRSIEQLPVLYKVAERAGAAGLFAKSIKLYLDGVIPQKTAAVLEPYVGTKDDLGELHIPAPLMNNIITQLDSDGYQVYVHAIGDRATREALNAFEAALGKNGKTGNRHLIAHLNIVSPQDQSRFGLLGVAANFQPLWSNNNAYMDLTIDRLGPERAQQIYPTNSILQAGGRLAFGADWSVAPADPFMGIEVAMTRSALEDSDVELHGEPLLADEGITLEEAIKAYTIDVAYITHRETVTGSIEVGKSADLIVADQNIFDVPVTDIGDTNVVLTLFRGQVVHGSLSEL